MNDPEYFDDVDDLEFYPEPVSHPAGPLLHGTVVTVQTGYTREVKVGQPFLVGVLAAAGLTMAVARLLVSLLPGGITPGSVWRNWKGLRKGPEYLVTPVHLRDPQGTLCEVEIHGYLSPTALEPGDLLRARIKPQRDRELPPRVERLSNLTTGQVLRPAPPTVWSHLGPALLLQAIGGGILAATLVACGVAIF